MRSLLIVIALAGVAHADGVSGSSEGSFTLLQHFADQRPVTAVPIVAPDPTITQLGLLGARFGLMPSDPMVAEHIAFDFAIGGQIGRHGGFAYDVALMPLGLGIHLGDDSFLALDTGVAAMGATGSLDDAILVPI